MSKINERKKREDEMNNSYPPLRVSRPFENELKDIMRERIRLGKDDPLRPTPPWRLTLANIRHPAWQKVKSDIILADLKTKEDKDE